MVNTPIQTRSSACQNRLKQNRRRTTVVRNPKVTTLRHHDQQPQQAGTDMAAMRAHQRKEG